MKLSFCMIVKNEEAFLPRCLNSVKDFVDEMVVLDTGSTDNTIEVAKVFGAKVYNFTWSNDFAVARNESLKYVTGDWILVLDADEVLNSDIIPQLTLAMANDRYLVINLVRQEVGAVQSPYSLVSRLFRHHPQVRFSRPYHAMIDDSVQVLLQQEKHWEVGYLPEVAILHYGYHPGAIASRHKLKNARIAMERFLVTSPNDPYVCSKLGALYVESERVNYGIELLEKGLRAKDTNASILYELHYHLGNAYSRLSSLPQAAEHYQIAIHQPILSKLKLGAYNNLGNLRHAMGDFAGAKTLYEMALQVDPNFALGYYNLGMALKALGLFEDAIVSYRRAINLNPQYAEAYQNLAVALLKIGNVSESMSAFKQAIILHLETNPEEAARLRQGLQEIGFKV